MTFLKLCPMRSSAFMGARREKVFVLKLIVMLSNKWPAMSSAKGLHTSLRIFWSSLLVWERKQSCVTLICQKAQNAADGGMFEKREIVNLSSQANGTDDSKRSGCFVSNRLEIETIKAYT